MRSTRVLAALVLGLFVFLSGTLAVAVAPVARPADSGAIVERLEAQPPEVVLEAWVDRSTYEVEAELAVGLSAAGIRTLWCETVGHAAIAQRLSITMWQGERWIDAPTDCGLIDDGVAAIVRSTAPWLLALVTSCLLLLARPWLVARLRRSIEHGHPRWAGCWSSVAACLPVVFVVSGVLFVGATTQHDGLFGFASLFTTLAMAFPIVALVVAAITGAVMGPRLVHSDRAATSWPFIRLALAEVVLGAVITGAAIGVVTGWAAGVATGLMMIAGATLFGLVLFGLPMLLATGAHVLVWHALLSRATDRPSPVHTRTSSVDPRVVTPA